MTQVPSAEAFIADKTKGWDDHRPFYTHEVQEWLIEYAKLHREAIMKAADEHLLEQGYAYAGYDGNAIRESYPIELIK